MDKNKERIVLIIFEALKLGRAMGVDAEEVLVEILGAIRGKRPES